jgi:hypothetical protein
MRIKRIEEKDILSREKEGNIQTGEKEGVVVEYLTSSPVNDTRRHYKREYFIYKLFM